MLSLETILNDILLKLSSLSAIIAFRDTLNNSNLRDFLQM